ncbi:MAG TPA: hypothetical protein VFR63_14625 [Gaiellaceae bacterium]|jgi:hypothetical protein|nr:hypothetical protein [Gaiellaceae bacterium]
MGVFLHCYLCGRKQADGLLSRNTWGHLRLESGQTLTACPMCKEGNDDWEQRLRATLNGSGLGHLPGSGRAAPWLGRTGA